MLPQEEERNETLFRGVILNPTHWKESEDRPSSAIFKDSRGVSVDKQDGRSEQECTLFLREGKQLKAIVSVTTEDCSAVGVIVKDAPIPDNPHHAEIHKSAEVVQLSSRQARKLLSHGKVCWKAG